MPVPTHAHRFVLLASNAAVPEVSRKRLVSLILVRLFRWSMRTHCSWRDTLAYSAASSRAQQLHCQHPCVVRRWQGTTSLRHCACLALRQDPRVIACRQLGLAGPLRRPWHGSAQPWVRSRAILTVAPSQHQPSVRHEIMYSTGALLLPPQRVLPMKALCCYTARQADGRSDRPSPLAGGDKWTVPSSLTLYYSVIHVSK